MTVNSNSQTEWRSTKEIQHFLCLVLMLRFSFATFQNGPPISANGPLRLANGVVHFGWRGPFGQMEGSVSKRTPPFTTKGPPHFAKWTHPFGKTDPSVFEMDPSSSNEPLHFAKCTPLFRSKRTPPFWQMDPFFLRNGPLHFAKWGGPFEMEGSISQNGGVHLAKWRGPFRNGPLHFG